VNQPHRSDPDFIVLHTLRCIGVSSEERIAGASGMEIAETLARLRHLYDRGLVELDPGPFGGWSLTVNGLTTGQEMVREEVVMAGGHQQVLGGYQAFLRLNPALLQICSDWQMQRVGNSPILNNHTDPDYDAKVLSRLIRIDDAAQQVCSDLASHLMRFGSIATVSRRQSSGPWPATVPTSPTASTLITRCGSSSMKTFS